MLVKSTFPILLFAAGLAVAFVSCDKDDNTVTIPASDGSTTTLNGGTGGANAVNAVFVDFSTDGQDSVARASWDLGFYSSATDFRVIINNTTGASVKSIARTDLTAVTTSDTTGFASALALGQGAGNFDIIDDVEGDLTNTAIDAISATASENLVYILKPANGLISAARDWYKIRITRSGSNYQLQYAKLSETTVKTLTITKDASYNFQYISLDNNGPVTVEPKKAGWDIEWTATTYKASATIPYTYSDFVYTNTLGGATSAQILTSSVSYDDYASANADTTTFSSSKTTIGSNWRATTGTVGVKTDRFYVVKDAAGNIYKLKFISFISNDGGVRGYPKIEYKLVKKA